MKGLQECESGCWWVRGTGQRGPDSQSAKAAVSWASAREHTEFIDFIWDFEVKRTWLFSLGRARVLLWDLRRPTWDLEIQPDFRFELPLMRQAVLGDFGHKKSQIKPPIKNTRPPKQNLPSPMGKWGGRPHRFHAPSRGGDKFTTFAHILRAVKAQMADMGRVDELSLTHLDWGWYAGSVDPIPDPPCLCF